MFAVLYKDLVRLEMGSQWSVCVPVPNMVNFSQPKQNAYFTVDKDTVA